MMYKKWLCAALLIFIHTINLSNHHLQCDNKIFLYILSWVRSITHVEFMGNIWVHLKIHLSLCILPYYSDKKIIIF